MGKSAPELIKKVYVNKDNLQEHKLKNAIAKIQKWIFDFNGFMDRMAEFIKGKRFIMFEQDVWYDYKTGLLLPQFDKGICNHYDLDSFGEWAKSNSPNDFNIPFCGFIGRVITSEECEAIFSSKHSYSSNANYFHKFLGDYILTSSSWETYKNPYPFISEYNEYNGKFRKMYVVPLKEEMWCGNGNTNKLLTGSPFKDGDGLISFLVLAKKENFVNAEGNVTDAVLIPVFPITKSHENLLSPLNNTENKDLSFTFLKYGLIPLEMSQDDKSKAKYFKDTFASMEKYVNLDEISLRAEIQSNFNENFSIPQIYEPNIENIFDFVKYSLLYSDTRRANLTPYHARVLTDINMGHWELYEQISNPPQNFVAVDLEQEVSARPPQMDVRESGICAIDFGTKSTVVVCRNREERLLRVGKTDYHKAPTMEDYENPTAIELRDIESFLAAYNAREGRPFTEWEQITVSHQALDRLLQNEGHSIYQSVFSELKQWANEKNNVRRLRDQKDVDLLLPAYDKLKENDFDPIEIYAYYLGLYINNMINGIYLEYILSFPVNYEKSIRERLRDSFERGIKKSLPPAILNDSELMEDFRLYAGASEPAAYASCALKELGKTDVAMRPTEKQPIYYGVFDFGGGTTDFDYGIWRLPTPKDKGSWNFVIEHFHAGGDVHLGGEKLLNILAYEVYQANIDIMRKKEITFALPENCDPFVGWEMLLTKSDAAYLNRRRLSELLRPIWEEKPEHESMGNEPQEVKMYRDSDMVSVQLRIDVPKLKEILRQRIKQGVESFFVGLLNAFRDEPAPRFDILMAGNSCKSKIVQELFQEEMKRREEEIKLAVMESQGQEKDFQGIFRLHLPLGSGEQKSERNFDRIPTGKTGVAFGLLDCRKGGHDVLVIDRNLSAEKESPFRYYIGYSDRADKFHVLISKGVGYQEWVPFFYTDDDRFEVYYSSEPRVLGNQIDITEVPAPKKCRIHYLDGHEEGMIYLRKVAPNRIEYTVAGEDGIVGEYYANVESVELGE